tara:strand:+ start:144 stop:503 length:360 start_codon:yes stop_codon:yes gene_type:complete
MKNKFNIDDYYPTKKLKLTKEELEHREYMMKKYPSPGLKDPKTCMRALAGSIKIEVKNYFGIVSAKYLQHVFEHIDNSLPMIKQQQIVKEAFVMAENNKSEEDIVDMIAASICAKESAC